MAGKVGSPISYDTALKVDVTPDADGKALLFVAGKRVIVTIKDGVPRSDNVKRCGYCNEVKPLSEYTKRRKEPDGLQPYCRTCLAERQRKIDNKPEQKAKKRERYQKQKEQTGSIPDRIRGLIRGILQ